MQTALQLVFDGMPQSEALKQNIRERVEKLEQFSKQIISCRVSVEAGHHHHQGKLYHIRIDLQVPDKELVVSRDQHKNHAHEDVLVAIRDAFKAITRQLEDYERQFRGDVKKHAVPLHGKVVTLDLQEGFGFIETANERQIYFHRNSVLDADFEKLEIGKEVRFAEEQGEQGPQASTVHVIGKHHVVG